MTDKQMGTNVIKQQKVDTRKYWVPIDEIKDKCRIGTVFHIAIVSDWLHLEEKKNKNYYP